MEPSLTSRGLMFTLLKELSHLATLLFTSFLFILFAPIYRTAFKLSFSTFQILSVPQASLSLVLQTVLLPTPTNKLQFAT